MQTLCTLFKAIANWPKLMLRSVARTVTGLYWVINNSHACIGPQAIQHETLTAIHRAHCVASRDRLRPTHQCQRVCHVLKYLMQFNNELTHVNKHGDYLINGRLCSFQSVVFNVFICLLI